VLTTLPILGARPAGACTCDRAATENTAPAGKTCACGMRAAGMLSFVLPCAMNDIKWGADPVGSDACSCEKNKTDGGLLPMETDFTTKAAGA